MVVNLALPESTNALPNERQIVENRGIEYIHIPVIWENPTLDDFKHFMSEIEANRDKKIFVHCAANMRVSAFMYLYRLIHEGMSEEQAKQDLHQIWTPNETWQRFIQQVIEHYQ